jgi:hypothetical protein
MDDGVSGTAAAQMRATIHTSRVAKVSQHPFALFERDAACKNATSRTSDLSIHDDLVARIRIQTTVLRWRVLNQLIDVIIFGATDIIFSQF